MQNDECVMTPDKLCDRLLDFSARIGRVVDALPDTRLGRHIAGQLVRCGTSAAPNYEEGCAADSKKDFIHKLSIALKELRESRSWIAHYQSEFTANRTSTRLARRMHATLQHRGEVHHHREK